MTNGIIKTRIQEEIKRSHLTQSELAKRLSVSQSCVAHYVKGDIMPSLDTFAELCRVLNVDPAYLLGLDDIK